MKTRSFAVVGLAVLAAVLLLPAPARAETDTSRAIEKLFREGVDYFEMGDFKNAKIRFEQVLKLDPTKAEAARLVKEAGFKVMTRMMTGDRVGRGPHYIWELYRDWTQQRNRNDERTRQIVAQAVDPRTSEVVVWKLIHELQDIGQYAMPLLAPHLGNQKDEDKRTRARIICQKLGPDVVLALIELLEHDSLLLRENAAMILGDIEPSDSRAVGPLMRVLEDDKSPAPFKSVATRALEKITGLRPSELRPAREYYYLKADRYLREVPGVPYEAGEAEGIVWYLAADGTLKAREVPMYAWNEQMAEQACYDLLHLDPTYERAVPLYAQNMAQQISEAQNLLDIVAEKPSGRPFTADEIAEIKARKARLHDDGELLLRSVGAKYVYRALGKSLKEGTEDPKAIGQAVVLINALKDIDPYGLLLPGASAAVAAGETGRGKRGAGGHDILDEIELEGDLGLDDEPAAATPETAGEDPIEFVSRAEGSPLCSALDYYDERVSYAAAIALAHMDPVKNFPGSKKVVSILGEAVGESGPLQILIVENDPNILNDMKSKLEGFGHGVTAARAAREGLAAAQSFPPKDVVLVGRKLPDDAGMATPELLRELSQGVRTGPVPVAILTSHGSMKTDELNKKLAGYKLLPREDSGRALREGIERIAVTRGLPVVSKLHAEEVSIAAAQALTLIDPYHTNMVSSDCARPCIAALQNRSDEVRNPCIIALGQFKIGKAFPTLIGLFTDKANTLELRTNTLRSLGQIRPQSAYALFLKTQKGETDYGLRSLGATGHGKGKPAMNTLIRFLDSERIQKSAKEE